ncbi:MAG: DNA integrity scanning protein DisA nucleotide-binding domain protein [Candidatus Hydrogenedentes bacterium]|nr:DNA integrity scanning protein DisA nucleotide-binding domain protein [Candidatus Hydrogenedentota bacterium]
MIWGLVHSGPRWVHEIHGGRHSFSPLRGSLVVCVTDPGRLTVRRGPATIASLSGAEISCPTTEVFDTKWFPQCFESTRAELWALHVAARERAGNAWAKLDPDIVRRIAQQVDRRVISTIRNSRHGGTLVFLPVGHAAAFAADNPYMTMRYQFAAEEPRNRFRTLIVKLMNALAEEFGPQASHGDRIGWNDYVSSRSDTLSMLEEGIMEVAHLVAGLAAMDGAVVLTNKYELLGCGAEIACELEKVPTVAKAFDAEATRTAQVAADGFGARHRSAYRLCHALHDVIAIVISQDRTVQFVKWNNDAVTYWDQVATSVLDI